MKQHHDTLTIPTETQGLVDITAAVRDVVEASRIDVGTCTVFILHSSASLLIQENADPAVLRDLDKFLGRLVPEDESLYEHSAEGADDMPSHVRAALTQASLTIPVLDGDLRLGPWQGILLWEHRRQGHRRKVAVHCIGE